MDGENATSELCDDNLTNANDEPYTNEDEVGENTREPVQLIMDLSADKHVKDLEEHEECEDESQMATWANILVSLVERVNTVGIVWAAGVDCAFLSRNNDSIELIFRVTLLRNDVLSVEHEEEDDEGLTNTHTKDVLDHLT